MRRGMRSNEIRMEIYARRGGFVIQEERHTEAGHPVSEIHINLPDPVGFGIKLLKSQSGCLPPGLWDALDKAVRDRRAARLARKEGS